MRTSKVWQRLPGAHLQLQVEGWNHGNHFDSERVGACSAPFCVCPAWVRIRRGSSPLCEIECIMKYPFNEVVIRSTSRSQLRKGDRPWEGRLGGCVVEDGALTFRHLVSDMTSRNRVLRARRACGVWERIQFSFLPDSTRRFSSAIGMISPPVYVACCGSWSKPVPNQIQCRA